MQHRVHVSTQLGAFHHRGRLHEGIVLLSLRSGSTLPEWSHRSERAAEGASDLNCGYCNGVYDVRGVVDGGGV